MKNKFAIESLSLTGAFLNASVSGVAGAMVGSTLGVGLAPLLIPMAVGATLKGKDPETKNIGLAALSIYAIGAVIAFGHGAPDFMNIIDAPNFVKDLMFGGGVVGAATGIYGGARRGYQNTKQSLTLA